MSNQQLLFLLILGLLLTIKPVYSQTETYTQQYYSYDVDTTTYNWDVTELSLNKTSTNFYDIDIPTNQATIDIHLNHNPFTVSLALSKDSQIDVTIVQNIANQSVSTSESGNYFDVEVDQKAIDPQFHFPFVERGITREITTWMERLPR